MTPEEMKRLQDAHVASETNKDIEAAMATYHDDCYYHNVTLGFRVEGKDQIRDFYQNGWDTFPDGVVTIEGEAFGDNVAVHWGTFRAHASDTLFGQSADDIGLDPAGQGVSVEFPVIAVLTFKDGLVHAEHLLFDLATVCDSAPLTVDQVRAVAATSPYPKFEQAWGDRKPYRAPSTKDA